MNHESPKSKFAAYSKDSIDELDDDDPDGDGSGPGKGSSKDGDDSGQVISLDQFRKK